MKITITKTKQMDVAFLQAECGVRYWEDASVNGISDDDGTLIPCRNGDCWSPLIDLAAGAILNWDAGKSASIHYKVCDDGRYSLLDAEKNVVKTIDGYVPRIMCPEENGYGDYVIMEIDAGGKIANWRCDLRGFEDAE